MEHGTRCESISQGINWEEIESLSSKFSLYYIGMRKSRNLHNYINSSFALRVITMGLPRRTKATAALPTIVQAV